MWEKAVDFLIAFLVTVAVVGLLLWAVGMLWFVIL